MVLWFYFYDMIGRVTPHFLYVKPVMKIGLNALWSPESITKTCPCNEHHLTPHFYIVTTPYTPLLYSKTGVYWGIHFFLIFASKHRLLVLVRTASLRRFYSVPTIYVLSKNMKNITIFHLKIIIFTAVKYHSILHGHIGVMPRRTVFGYHGGISSLLKESSGNKWKFI